MKKNIKLDIIVLAVIIISSFIILFPHKMFVGEIDYPYLMESILMTRTNPFDDCSFYNTLMCNRIVAPSMVLLLTKVTSNFFNYEFAMAVSIFIIKYIATIIGLFILYKFIKKYVSYEYSMIGILIFVICTHFIYFNYGVTDTLIFIFFALGFYAIREKKSYLWLIILLGFFVKETIFFLVIAYFISNIDYKKIISNFSLQYILTDTVILKSMLYSIEWLVLYFAIRVYRYIRFDNAITEQFVHGFMFKSNLYPPYLMYLPVYLLAIIIAFIISTKDDFLKRNALFFSLSFIIFTFCVGRISDARIFLPLLIIIIPIYLIKFKEMVDAND